MASGRLWTAKWLAGNARRMRRENVVIGETIPTGTAVHIAVDRRYEGFILIEDEIKLAAGLRRGFGLGNLATM